MSDLQVSTQDKKAESEAQAELARANEREVWQTPKMEDVSEQVMAQPYIRFT